MNVRQLINTLEGLDPEAAVRIDHCLNTPGGQVFWSDDLDHVSRVQTYGRNEGAIVLCNWDDPAVNLSDLKPID